MTAAGRLEIPPFLRDRAVLSIVSAPDQSEELDEDEDEDDCV